MDKGDQLGRIETQASAFVLEGVSQQVLPGTLNKTQELKYKCLTAYVRGSTEMDRYMEVHF